MTEESETPAEEPNQDQEQEEEEKYWARVEATVGSAFDRWVAKADEELHQEEQKSGKPEKIPEQEPSSEDSGGREPQPGPGGSDAQRQWESGRAGRRSESSFWRRAKKYF